MNAQKNYNVYWSLLKIFLNNNKMPIILPLFYEKSKIFNILFSKQCSLIPNNSSVPADVNYITDKRLSTRRYANAFNAFKILLVLFNVESWKAKNEQMNYSSQLFENLKNQKNNNLVKAIFGCSSCRYEINK